MRAEGREVMDQDQDRLDSFESCTCDECRHYFGEGKCLAFPEGIPQAILSGDVEHCHPVAGDKGITFEPRE